MIREISNESKKDPLYAAGCHYGGDDVGRLHRAERLGEQEDPEEWENLHQYVPVG